MVTYDHWLDMTISLHLFIPPLQFIVTKYLYTIQDVDPLKKQPSLTGTKVEVLFRQRREAGFSPFIQILSQPIYITLKGKSLLGADDFLKSFDIGVKIHEDVVRLSGLVGYQEAVDKAGRHKEDPQCGGGYCGDPPAVKCIRCHRQHFRNSRWKLNRDGNEILSIRKRRGSKPLGHRPRCNCGHHRSPLQ